MDIMGELSTSSKALLTVLVIIMAQRLVSNYFWNKKYKLPTRVPGIPIFGNTFQLPPIRQGLWAQEQAKKYGEMYTCTFGVNTWVFLNSSRLVTELMEKRSAIYSSRVNAPVASSLMSAGCRVLLMPYSDRWRAIRKVMHTILGKQNAAIFAPFQDIESKHALYDYLRTPDKWYIANQRFANSVIMSVVFGKRMELENPQTKELLETATEILTALQPGAFVADSLPILEKLPNALQWWRPGAERAQAHCMKIYQREVDDLKARMAAGTARDCYATRFMSSPESTKFGPKQFLFSLGSMMEAGSDTSRISISQIICAAIIDPRWVVTARAALDSVCGSNGERLPEFSDRPNLQYITAVVKEGFRWRPMAPIGFPHMLTEDDEFEGYRFPKGTVFTWNAFAISLDEREYEQAARFWPERFMNDDVDHVLKGLWAFGPGRRVCTGYNVGESNVWIMIARLLYCFDFEAVEGEVIDSLRVDWLGFKEAPFPVSIKPRSPQHAALIEREGKPASETKY